MSMLPYLRRWAVQGSKPNGDKATTIFDLPHDRRRVVVYPATVATYAVVVAASGMRMLATTASAGTSCAVPADHAAHGRRLLGLHPYPPAQESMELYLVLPGDEIHIVYGHDQLRLLVAALTEITALLT